MMDCVSDAESCKQLELQITESKIPWDEIIPDGCSPFLYEKMEKAGISESIPPAIRKNFEERLIKNTGANIVRLRELDTVVESLNEAGIEPVLLKGACLLNTVYDHPGHRGMSDIDILVEPSLMKTASEVFIKLGYKKNGEKGHHINFVAEREFPVLFELHHDLFNRANPLHKYAYPISTSDLISRSELFLLNNKRTRIFEKTDQFLFLCCHTAKEKTGSLKLIADLCVSIEKKCPDQETFFSRCIEYDLKIPDIIMAYLSCHLKSVRYDLLYGNFICYDCCLKFDSEIFTWGNLRHSRFDEYIYYIKQIHKPVQKVRAILESPFYFVSERINKS